ncbi:hypothetical protein [Natrarchaeobius oligotrophus]|nr:hypothetical protein [Natrarchaeobius chitinivorans]
MPANQRVVRTYPALGYKAFEPLELVTVRDEKERRIVLEAVDYYGEG